MEQELVKTHLDSSEKDRRASYKVDGKVRHFLTENADNKILCCRTFPLVHRRISEYHAQKWICLLGKSATKKLSLTRTIPFGWIHRSTRHDNANNIHIILITQVSDRSIRHVLPSAPISLTATLTVTSSPLSNNVAASFSARCCASCCSTLLVPCRRASASASALDFATLFGGGALTGACARASSAGRRGVEIGGISSGIDLSCGGIATGGSGT
jgi:hypothetical protein